MIIVGNLSNNKNNRKYTYTDIDVSLEKTQNSDNNRNSDVVAKNDIIINTDERAILNSVQNILLQKRYLTPKFGANLRNFIGQPLSDMGAVSVGEEINRNITLYEPRIKVQNIYVVPDYDNYMYVIAIILSIPNFKNKQLILNGKLSTDGDLFFGDK